MLTEYRNKHWKWLHTCTSLCILTERTWWVRCRRHSVSCGIVSKVAVMWVTRRFHCRFWGAIRCRQVWHWLTVSVDVSNSAVGCIITPCLGCKGITRICRHRRRPCWIFIFVGPKGKRLPISRICGNIIVGRSNSVSAKCLSILGVEGRRCGGAVFRLIVPRLSGMRVSYNPCRRCCRCRGWVCSPRGALGRICRNGQRCGDPFGGGNMELWCLWGRLKSSGTSRRRRWFFIQGAVHPVSPSFCAHCMSMVTPHERIRSRQCAQGSGELKKEKIYSHQIGNGRPHENGRHKIRAKHYVFRSLQSRSTTIYEYT